MAGNSATLPFIARKWKQARLRFETVILRLHGQKAAAWKMQKASCMKKDNSHSDGVLRALVNRPANLIWAGLLFVLAWGGFVAVSTYW